MLINHTTPLSPADCFNTSVINSPKKTGYGTTTAILCQTSATHRHGFVVLCKNPAERCHPFAILYHLLATFCQCLAILCEPFVILYECLVENSKSFAENSTTTAQNNKQTTYQYINSLITVSVHRINTDY
jgi:hypothetical protein